MNFYDDAYVRETTESGQEIDPASPPKDKFALGAVGEHVDKLQSGLTTIGLLRADAATGTIDAETLTAIKLFQQESGLPSTGNFDPATSRALDLLLVGEFKRGTRSEQVGALQRKLRDMGYMTQQQIDSGPGIFGPKTESALKQFQSDKGLESTGIVNDKTFIALRSIQPASKRGDQGRHVEDIQTKLVELGYMSEQQVSTGFGIFGPRTESALKRFQTRNNLPASGVADERTRLALRSATPIADDITSGLTPGRVTWPVPTVPISNGSINRADKDGEGDGFYGSPRPFNASGKHTGIDIVGKVGDTVVACGEGVVLFAGSAGKLGNVVVIDHGGGVHSIYAHLNTVAVRQGEQIDETEQVGTMGRTGNTPRAGDTHLHFEIRVDAGTKAFNASGYISGKSVDPLFYF
ncbi:MAG: peptidoglycan-binding protein [Casimicrobium sp.]